MTALSGCALSKSSGGGGGTTPPPSPPQFETGVTDPDAPTGFQWPVEDLTVFNSFNADLREFRKTELELPGGSQAYDYLLNIGAGYVYARGANGSGVNVAVVDDGISTVHQDTTGTRWSKATVTTGTVAQDNVQSWTFSETYAPRGHGTTVAAAIGGTFHNNSSLPIGSMGVAYGANIIDVALHSYADEFCGGTGVDCVDTAADRAYSQDTLFYASVTEAIEHADYVNLSLTSENYLENYTDLAAAKTAFQGIINVMLQSSVAEAMRSVFVQATGNDGESTTTVTLPDMTVLRLRDNPFADSMLPRDGIAPGVRPYFVAVVATQQNGTIADFSNRCGYAADWCLSAPGHRIYLPDYIAGTSTAVQRRYGVFEGTSFATPIVSGGLALIDSLFMGQLSPKEVLERLLETADRSGVYATSAIYGRGFIDLRNAATPQGTMMMMSGSSATNVGGSKIAAKRLGLSQSSPLALGVARSLAGRQIMVLDSLNAPFLVSAAQLVRTPRHKRPSTAQWQGLNRARSTWTKPLAGAPLTQLRSQIDANLHLMLSSGSSGDAAPWLDDWLGHQVDDSFATPWRVVFESRADVGLRLNLHQSDLRLDLTMCQGWSNAQRPAHQAYNHRTPSRKRIGINPDRPLNESGSGQCASADLLWNSPNQQHFISLSSGLLLERQQMLGLVSTADQSLVNDMTQTGYLGLRGRTQLAHGHNLLWSVWQGWTDSAQQDGGTAGAAGAAGAAQHLSYGIAANNVLSSAMSFSYQWSTWLNGSPDSPNINANANSGSPWQRQATPMLLSMEWNLTRPLSVIAGQWQVQAPVARTPDGQVLWQQQAATAQGLDNWQLALSANLSSQLLRLGATVGVARPDSQFGDINRPYSPYAGVDVLLRF